MASRTLRVELVGDAESLLRAFGRASQGATRFNQNMSRTFRGVVAGSGAFGSLGRSVAFASSAFLGGAGFIAVVKSSFDEMAQGQKVAAQTAAVLQSTGAIAGVSAKQVDTLATSILNMSGIDDEATKSAENLLLTFTNVRDVVGQGNNIFDQATQAVANLATRMSDGAVPSAEAMTTAALQIGKALQDPVRGMTALRRAGVSFSEAQQTVIKRLVASGDVLDAQKIILRELQTEFGGAAAAAGDTLSGKLATLRETALNLGGTLAATLAPQITSVVDKANAWLGNTANQDRIQQKFTATVHTLSDVISRISGIVQDVVGKLGGWGNTLTILGGLFIAWKVTALASTAAVVTANIVAAGVVERTWQAALIATGWGVFAVAAGIAAAEVIAHWQKVKVFFSGLWIWLQATAKQAALSIIEPFTHIPDWAPSVFGKLGKFARAWKEGLQSDIAGLENDFANLGSAAEDAGKKVTTAVPTGMPATVPPAAPPGGAPPGAAGGRRGITQTQRNTWFDAAINRQLSRVQDIPTLQGQIAQLRVIAGLVQQRLDATRDVTRRLTLEDQLLEIIRTIKGDQAQLEQQAADAADKEKQARADFMQHQLDAAQLKVDQTGLTETYSDDLAALLDQQKIILAQIKVQGATLQLQRDLLTNELAIKGKRREIADARKAARDAAREAAKAAAEQAAEDARRAHEAFLENRRARQFRALGLTAEGEQPTPGVEALQRRLAKLREAVAGTVFNTAQTKAMFRRIGRVLAEGVNAVGQPVRAAIDQMMDTLDEKMKNRSENFVKRFRRVSSASLVAALGAGLTDIQKRRLEVGIASIGPGFRQPTGRSLAFAARGVTVNGDLHLHGVQDVSQLEDQIVKRTKARGHVRRGSR